MAADSRATESALGWISKCQKLFRKELTRGRGSVVIGFAGDSAPGLVFLDWYGSDTPPPESLLTGEADFTALVLSKAGLYEYDKWCRGEKVYDRFYAAGSGAPAALGAMHMGANARAAVRIACKVDPNSGGKIVTMAR